MVNHVDILNAISKELAKAYPGYKIYIDVCPVEYARPSFFLRQVGVTRADVNRNTIAEKLEYLLRVHENVDSYANSSALALLETQQAVMDIFRQGVLQVGDRWLRLSVEAGPRELNVANAALWVEYFDERETQAIEEDKIQTVEMRVRKEE